MAATSGPSSRDVSPPLGPTPGLTFKRENLQPSLGMGDTAMRPSATGNTNSPRPVVPASEHGIIAGGREKGLSSRDMGQNIQSSQNRKRSSVDSEEYPRRRAAIAVSTPPPFAFSCTESALLIKRYTISAKFVDRESRDVTARGQNAASVLS